MLPIWTERIGFDEPPPQPPRDHFGDAAKEAHRVFAQSLCSALACHDLAKHIVLDALVMGGDLSTASARLLEAESLVARAVLRATGHPVDEPVLRPITTGVDNRLVLLLPGDDGRPWRLVVTEKGAEDA